MENKCTFQQINMLDGFKLKYCVFIKVKHDTFSNHGTFHKKMNY